MNSLDEKIKEAIKQEIELPKDFQNSVRETLENCIQDSVINKNINKHRVLNILKKVIATIVIGASTITVYATATKKLPFKEMGLIKAGENYEKNAVGINETIENDYAIITLESMAGDGAYIIAEYKINLKEKAINEYGNISYNEAMGYNLWLSNNVFVNSNKIKNKTEKVTKVSDNEYIYTQVINVMDIEEENLNLKIYIDSLCVSGNYSNPVEIGKIIQTEVKFKNSVKSEFIAQEQILDEKNKIIINNVGNTKFETYITAQKITENITYKEYKKKDPFKYNSFIVTDQNGDEIPYTIRYSVWAGEYFYIKNQNGEMELTNSNLIKDNDIIKHVENFIILIGNQDNKESVKVVPIETSIFNDRTNEEKEEYKKVKWYPLVEGEKKYSAQSSLGGTFEIEKIEITENDVNFYYNQKGLIGDESLVIRKNNGTMNYIYSIRKERAGVNSNENKIVFSKDLIGASGLNVWRLENMFDNIEDVEFALFYGNRSKIIADTFIIEIPKQNNNIAEFSKVEVLDTKRIKLECTFEKHGISEMYDYTICYDENDKVLSFKGDMFPPMSNIDINKYTDATELVEVLKKHFVEIGGTCNKIQE